MKRIILEQDTLTKTCGYGTGTLLIIRCDVAPPSEEARAYIRDELRRSPMLAAAQVVTGKGFVGAAMRSVLSLIQLLGRPPYPMKVFADVRSASAWLAAELKTRAGHAPGENQLAVVAGDAEVRFLNRQGASE